MATVPVQASGIRKTTAMVLESTYGTNPVTGGQLYPRVSHQMGPNVALIESQVISPSGMPREARLGVPRPGGVISSQLCAGTFAAIFQAVLRGTWATALASGTLTNSVVAVDATTGNMTLASSGANFITTGFRRGDLVRIGGATAGGAVNNGENLQTIALTATQFTYAPPPGGTAVWASGDQTAVVVSQAGKKLIIPTPASSQVNRGFSIEDWYSDISRSDLISGARWTQMSISAPPEGPCTFQASYSGRTFVAEGTSQKITSPTAAAANNSLTFNGGRILYGGVPIAVVGQVSLQVVSDAEGNPMAGSNTILDIVLGIIRVRGSLTATYIADTLTADFLNETEVELAFTLTDGLGAGSNAISFYLPRVRLASFNKSDGQRVINRSFNFVAMEVVNGTPGWDQTMLTVIDTLAA